MEKQNPFAGSRTCRSYPLLAALTALVLAAQAAVFVLAALLARGGGPRLDSYEASLPAFALSGWISWKVLDGLGVS